MSIETYGNDQNFHKVLKVEVIDGSIEGMKRLIIHQLVETEREDYNFEPYNGQFVMKHTVDLFAADETTIEVDVT